MSAFNCVVSVVLLCYSHNLKDFNILDIAANTLVSRRSHTDRNHKSRDLDRSSQIADRSFEIAVKIAAFRTRLTQQMAV